MAGMAGACALALACSAPGSPAAGSQPAAAGGAVPSTAAPVAAAGTVPMPPAAEPEALAPPAAPDPVPADPPATQPTPAPAPAGESPEAALRAEVQRWRQVPYQDNGQTRRGIGNAGFVRAIAKAVLTIDLPESYEGQYRSGKLVPRNELAPGDLVFFEGPGFGPFKSRAVGLFLGGRDVALARKEDGVTVVSIAASAWASKFKTARRVPRGEAAKPVFDLAKYGTNRAQLLRDIAEGWKGVLYRTGGKTFEGIGNDEFVREVYGAIYETDLNGEPKDWEKMGDRVARDKLEPGDIIIYDAGGLGQVVSQRHAGLYLGDGEFVAAVRGSAVSILEVSDPKWQKAYKTARRIDPDVLARLEDAQEARAAARAARAGAGRGAAPPDGTSDRAPAAAVAGTGLPHTVTEPERRLRDVTDAWRGTPYKLGGTSRSGIDCSAFSRVLYQDVYSVALPRTAEEQERLGRRVDRKDLQPGDLVFFRTQGMGPLFRSRHVGVYLGGGQFAQASGRRGVTVSSLDNRYWSRKYHSARRLAPAA